jgi:UDPglucose 6-dehydrogenase
MDDIAIIGFGIIGRAVSNLLTNKKVGCIFPVDPPQKDMFSYSLKDINSCKYAFVCVPTPHMKFDGLDMSIVEEVIGKYSPEIFIICSALQPGTADRLSKKYNKRIVVQPEYFGETVGHPMVELNKQNFLILGGESKDVNEVIKLYKKIYNANIKIRKVTTYEAEIIKLSENRAIAYKVVQCQELYDACIAANVDYETIRQAVYGDDPRFNLLWTWVYEDRRGLTSSCLPKDVYGWQAWAKEVGIDPELTISLLNYNNKLLSLNK